MNTQLNQLQRLLAEIDSLMGSVEVSGLIRDARSCAVSARSVAAKAIKHLQEIQRTSERDCAQEERKAFDACCEYMIDATDEVNREWLWRFVLHWENTFRPALASPAQTSPVTAAGQLPEEIHKLLSRAQCQIEHLAECTENLGEDLEEDDVSEDVAEARAVAEEIGTVLAAAPVKGGNAHGS
ncbi:hypothetical protein [Pseudomonas sp. W03]|uniref:hypothetical protein n=1 Tax=Pseudomonas sp. W03 TaxID=3090666 RepID=UPI003A4DF7C8